MRLTLVLLALALLTAPALGQQEDGADDDSPFLGVSKAKVDDPPLGVSRPNDSWQFVDLDKVKVQLSAQGRSLAAYRTLKFQLWYGAARATIFVRAWKLPQKPSGKPADEQVAEARITELRSVLKDAKVGKRKRTHVGKRAGIWFEVSGKAPKPQNPTELHDLVIYSVVGYRPQDMAVVMASIEFSDTKRAKALAKDFKKLVKKVKF